MWTRSAGCSSGNMSVVDFREKTFAAEVADRFRFLVDEAGFTALRVDAPAHDRRPRSLRVAYVSTGARVEVSLDLAFGGEESVSTLLETGTGRWDFGPSVAHKGHAMRKALTAQAQQVAEVLHRMETERA